MNIMSNLLDILSIPEEPVDAGSPSSWDFVEEKVGIKLPNDYKNFINTYGTGWIGRFLYIWSPFTNTSYANFLINYPQRLEWWKEGQLPYPLYPETNGVLPFAATKDGDTLCWITKGLPDEWHICIFDPRSPDYDHYPFGLDEFLYRLLTGKIHGKTISSKSLELFTPISQY